MKQQRHPITRVLSAHLFCSTLLVLSSVTGAADWPQWRGPLRTGIASQSPALLDSFPAEGPKKVWTSETIPCDPSHGYSSPVVADGKVFVYVSHNIPRTSRIVSLSNLVANGYSPNIPAELAQKLEEARLSPERQKLGDTPEVAPWVEKWLVANSTKADSKYLPALRYRLTLGARLASIETMAKLMPIVDQMFESKEAWAAWVAQLKLSVAEEQAVLRVAGTGGKEASDFIYCLDAATGRTLWKNTFAGQWFEYAASSTPAIVDGKLYILSSEGAICCFSAADGTALWKSPIIGSTKNHHGRGSSVLISEGLAVAINEGGVNAVSLTDHTLAWCSAEAKSENCSAVLYASGGRNLFLVAGNKLALLDPQDGRVLASIAHPSYGTTPVVAGDQAVALATNGARIYDLAPDKIALRHTVPLSNEQYSSALIHDGYMYVVGGAIVDHYKKPPQGRALCVELLTGKIVWEEQSLARAELSSPLLVDGKIVAIAGPELVVFHARPEKFQLVGRTKLDLVKWTSPAIADGHVFVRTASAVVCLDLRK